MDRTILIHLSSSAYSKAIACHDNCIRFNVLQTLQAVFFHLILGGRRPSPAIDWYQPQRHLRLRTRKPPAITSLTALVQKPKSGKSQIHLDLGSAFSCAWSTACATPHSKKGFSRCCVEHWLSAQRATIPPKAETESAARKAFSASLCKIYFQRQPHKIRK